MSDNSIDQQLLVEARKMFIESDKYLQMAARASSKKGLLRAVRKAFHDTLTNSKINLTDADEINVAASLQNLLQSWTILKADQMNKIEQMKKEIAEKENANGEKE